MKADDFGARNTEQRSGLRERHHQATRELIGVGQVTSVAISAAPMPPVRMLGIERDWAVVIHASGPLVPSGGKLSASKWDQRISAEGRERQEADDSSDRGAEGLTQRLAMMGYDPLK